MVENFRGRTLFSQFHGLRATHESFLHEIWACHIYPPMIGFSIPQNGLSHRPAKVFSLESFPIYLVIFNHTPCTCIIRGNPVPYTAHHTVTITLSQGLVNTSSSKKRTFASKAKNHHQRMQKDNLSQYPQIMYKHGKATYMGGARNIDVNSLGLVHLLPQCQLLSGHDSYKILVFNPLKCH